MILNDNIRRFRREKGYSQEYMGLRLEVDQSSYSRIENGKIDMNMLERIAGVLDTTSETLRNYHLPNKSVLTVTDYNEKLLQQKDEIIQLLTEQVNYLRDENKTLLASLADYLRGGVNKLADVFS